MVKRGTIYWADLSGSQTSGEKELRPCLVIQNDVLNESRLNTTVVVAITSIPNFGKLPGNVIIEKGVANMPGQGIVNVSQVMSIEKNKIEAKIGTLSTILMEKVSAGLKLIMKLG
ncbi:MAG: type II toxin-antitoxin system PemK/MazF family toxin [Bacteroidetes bacterium]|nr:type II toxin-antitoxin system PemK/MazF family toxin [Bacteroidota bacterium]